MVFRLRLPFFSVVIWSSSATPGRSQRQAKLLETLEKARHQPSFASAADFEPQGYHVGLNSRGRDYSDYSSVYIPLHISIIFNYII